MNKPDGKGDKAADEGEKPVSSAVKRLRETARQREAAQLIQLPLGVHSFSVQ